MFLTIKRARARTRHFYSYFNFITKASGAGHFINRTISIFIFNASGNANAAGAYSADKLRASLRARLRAELQPQSYGSRVTVAVLRLPRYGSPKLRARLRAELRA